MKKEILKQDLEGLVQCDFIPFSSLDCKKILLTGATGLIGSNLIYGLVAIARTYLLNISIDAIVRSKEKAFQIFDDDVTSFKGLRFIEREIGTFSSDDTRYDYILHIASPSDSRYFLEHAVELIEYDYESTSNLLRMAKDHKAKFVYFSSMEVYGSPSKGKRVNESYTGAPDTMSARSSYSEGKRICETLCRSYYEEYGVEIYVVRLAQTFGPGVKPSDNRVFAQFARSVVNGQDIVLKTSGASERSMVYTMDAVSAILTIMLCGKAGEAYNVANETTYCSIRDMAEMVAREIGNGSIKVVYDIPDEKIDFYLPTLYMDLDCAKLQALGWHATVSLKEMFIRMIASSFT